MIIEPAHPSERYIEGRIAFAESAAELYTRYGEKKLAEWSREQAERWRARLPQKREAGADNLEVLEQLRKVEARLLALKVLGCDVERDIATVQEWIENLPRLPRKREAGDGE